MGLNKQELIKVIQEAVISNNGMIQCPKDSILTSYYLNPDWISHLEYLNVEYILDCLYDKTTYKEIDTMIYHYDILDIETLTKIYNYIKSMNKGKSTENKPPVSSN